jgi:hypothetical protein
MSYIFGYRRHWFWRRREVIGHKYEADQDKMVLFFKDGGVEEIRSWKRCEARLGPDWFAESKKAMEKQVGAPIAIHPE